MNRTRRIAVALVWAGLAAAYLEIPVVAQQTPIDGWTVSIDAGKSFHPIVVPGTVEDQIDVDFDGVSIYQRPLKPISLRDDERFLIRFAGAATQAKVYLGDQLVGQHLGAWTPFTVDATEAVRAMPPNQNWLLRVELDELVGHNTQGFLPIVTNHFGGLWQPVTWYVRGMHRIDSDRVHLHWNSASELRLTVPASCQDAQIRVAYRPLLRNVKDGGEGDGEWIAADVSTEQSPTGPIRKAAAGGNDSDRGFVQFHSQVRLPTPATQWTLGDPQLYQFRVELLTNQPTAGGGDHQFRVADQAIVTSGWRTMNAEGDRFLLNGSPIVLRGVLNWGYAPPSVAPSLDERWMRREIEFAQARGFNLMKFCLWIPPKRYLELCDEMGMLAWIEYPTWHPQLDDAHLADLRREYAEFFEYDRNHPSVVLRSLTCETGPSADIDVIRSLYDLCKSMVPGAIVVDDSSWISWNRVHDFYDDHPYGNNHTWVETLGKLKAYIADRETQPLMLGEAIAADSWTFPSDELLKFAERHPAHGPWFVHDNLRWQTAMVDLAGRRQRRFDPLQLTPTSLHYGLMMRKFQIETYRREVPHGGYVVSVIRDFPKAAMGLIDFRDVAKNEVRDWLFHGDAMLLLETENDRRSFTAGKQVPLKIHAVGGGPANPDGSAGKLSLTAVAADGQVLDLGDAEARDTADPNRSAYAFRFEIPNVVEPQRWILVAEWSSEQGAEHPIRNEWPIWVFPDLPSPPSGSFELHASAQSIAESLDLSTASVASRFTVGKTLVTRQVDKAVLEHLNQGGTVWLFPDGSEGSLPVSDHWFLRGSVVPLPPRRGSVSLTWPAGLFFEEMQHFDLAGPVVPEIDHYLNRVDPSVILWDNHDRDHVRTHGLLFSMDVGRGRLVVCALNLWGATNSAGNWLWRSWNGTIQQQGSPSTSTDDERVANYQLLLQEITRRAVPLHQQAWRFQPDPEDKGRQLGWHTADFNDADWPVIRADRHWEGQGYDALDDWAWYRLKVTIPSDWQSDRVFLNFTGIDDYALIYVNGQQIGTAGDLQTKQTAFDQRLSFDISTLAKAGEPMQIAIAVYDWYGAGGIFRPVTISSEPLSERPPILK